MKYPLNKRFTRLLLCVLFVGFVSQSKGEDWFQFRGLKGLGVSEQKGLPTKWSDNQNVVWKTKLPGAGASSPIAVKGKIYLTCYSGYGIPGQRDGDINQLKRHLVCMNQNDGKPLWTKALKVFQPEQTRVRDHGYAANTPVSDGEHLYVFCGKSGVFALDLSGKKLWHQSVGSRTSGWGTAASPILFGNLLIVNASVESGSIVALDKKTGEEIWRVNGIREAWNTPLLVSVGENPELVISIPGKVIAIDPKSGRELWTCSTGITWYMVPSMVAHNGTIYCTGGRSGKAGTLAIRAGGRGDVTDSHILWKSNKRSNVTSLIYHEGHLYFAHEQLGVAICLNAKSGKVAYEERLPRAGQIYSSPILADEKVYYVARRGGVFVLPAQPKFEILAHNTLRDRTRFDASPIISNGKLYLRSNSYLYCVDEQ